MHARALTSFTLATGAAPGQVEPQMGSGPFLAPWSWQQGKSVGASSHLKGVRHARHNLWPSRDS